MCVADDRRPVKVLLVAVGILALSGATAGLLGIGGALIFNPYLLQLGMDPRVRQQISPDISEIMARWVWVEVHSPRSLPCSHSQWITSFTQSMSPVCDSRFHPSCQLAVAKQMHVGQVSNKLVRRLSRDEFLQDDLYVMIRFFFVIVLLAEDFL